MANQDESSIELLDRVGERVDGLNVKMVGRLTVQRERGGKRERSGQAHSEKDL